MAETYGEKRKSEDMAGYTIIFSLLAAVMVWIPIYSMTTNLTLDIMACAGMWTFMLAAWVIIYLMIVLSYGWFIGKEV